MTDTTATTRQVHSFLPEPHDGGGSSHFISRSSSQSMTSVTADLSSQTPLLCASDSDPSSFPESQQPVQPVSASFDYARRPRSFNSGGYAVSRRRKRTLRDTLLHKRLRMFRMLKCGLEAFIAVWAVFNIIRYLVSYSKYATSQGQVAALALALSACLSLAFLGCAVLLSISRKYLKRRRMPLTRASHVIRKSIRSIAAFLIFAPALANVVLLFLWKDSDNQEISFKNRCHVDIDLVWSVFQDQCSAPAWGVWLALAFVRLVITLGVLAAYLIVSHAYGRTLKLSTAHRLSALAPYETTIVPSSATPTMKENSISQRHSKHRPSRSTLSSNIESTPPSVLPAPITRAGSSTSSEDEYAMRHPPPGLVSNHQNTEKTTDNPDHHFRTHVLHPSQDTDETLCHSRLSDEGEEDEQIEQYSSQPTSYAPYPPSSYTPYSYNLPPVPPSIGYNEFGQPYPPDEPLSVLHGIIRRMPTIESMGSRELGSVVTSSSMYTGPNVETRVPESARSTMTFERPPTRPISRTDLVGGASTTTSSSRPNSLGARAELMASLGGTTTTSELGELVSAESGQQGKSTTTTTEETVIHVNTSMVMASVSRATTATASTSRSSTMSFHTATSGSMYSGSPH